MPPHRDGERGHCTGFSGDWIYPQAGGTRPGEQLIQLHLSHLYVMQEGLREGVELLRRFHQPLEDRVGIDLEHPRRAPDAQTLSQAGEDTHNEESREMLGKTVKVR